MVKTLMISIREYKKDSIMSVVYIVFEVIMEFIIPFILAKLVNGIRTNMPLADLFKDSLLLAFMAMLSLAFVMGGRLTFIFLHCIIQNIRLWCI